MSDNTSTSEPKYEAYFDSDPDDPIQIFGWYPIPMEKIKDPERIDEYIEQGLLREIDKTNDSGKAKASEVRVDALVSDNTGGLWADISDLRRKIREEFNSMPKDERVIAAKSGTVDCIRDLLMMQERINKTIKKRLSEHLEYLKKEK